MEPLLKGKTLAWCLPGSQAYLKSVLQPFTALTSPSLLSCCLLNLHNAGYQGKGKAGPWWFWQTGTWLIQFTNLGQYFVMSLLVALHWNYLGSKQIRLPDFNSRSFKVGSSGGQDFFVVVVLGFFCFVFFFKSTTKNSGERTNKNFLYAKPQKIHMPIIFTWHGNLCVSSIVLAFKKNSCAVTVLVYSSSVTSVLHPMSCRTPQSHEMIYHKPPVISGYGNISQVLYIDYGFIMSQPGNFSLSSSLKLVSAGKSAVKQQTVSSHPTPNKHTNRRRIL